MINITDKAQCCGCNACGDVCAKHAITFKTDIEGFWYPEVNKDLCTDCGLCEKVCPIVNSGQNQKPLPLSVHAAHSNNDTIWKSSSSGGIFMTLAEYVISRGGVVFGAAYNQNLDVVHCSASTMEEVNRFRGSKYSQSNTQGVYQEVKRLIGGGYFVLFSGTPCQNSALLKYLGRTYSNLITCDIVCHGIPSPKVFSDYRHFIETKYKKTIVNIFMKDKTNGWGFHQSLRITFNDGSDIALNRDTLLWNTVFQSELVNRPSCHHCKFSNLHRVSDLTIGDFWGIEKKHPEFYNKNGVSLILVNTERGDAIWNEILNQVTHLLSSVDKCQQTALQSPFPASPLRDQFWMDYQKESFRNIAVKYWGYTSPFIKKLRHLFVRIKSKLK